MQFNRDAGGEMTPLPKPSVDTGLGLERLAAVVQGVHSNYEIDLFRSLIEAAAEVTGASNLDDKSLRVIADHIRACAFLVADGVVPSNEGRGYVLRRIVRRAIRHGHKLGMKDPFFHRLVLPLDKEMGAAYPELGERRELIERVLAQEEDRFAETLEQGLRLLDQAIGNLSGECIPGETLFKLYDTYGFPVDLTADVARERGLDVDIAGFETHMDAQRQRARDASLFGAAAGARLELSGKSEFSSYDGLSAKAEVLALIRDGGPVESLQPEDHGVVVLDRTPFYSEAGGQIGDRGVLTNDQARFEVADTQRQGELAIHMGVLTDGELRVGDHLEAKVDAPTRRAIARNHSATHVLHAALRAQLGDHVQQKGSLVAAGRLRFDFSHFEPVSTELLLAIERQVNDWILGNDAVVTRVLPLAEAMQSGAVALFGEKYEDPVRVLSIGDFSTELCGRHPCSARRRYRAVQTDLRNRHRCRRSPCRSGDRGACFGLAGQCRHQAQPRGGTGESGRRGDGGEGRSGGVPQPRAREGSGASEITPGVLPGRRPGSPGHRHQWPQGASRASRRRRRKGIACHRGPTEKTSWARPPWCSPRWTAKRSIWWPASLPTTRIASRRGRWQTSSPSRWVAAAVAVRTWPKPAATIRPAWNRPSRRCRTGSVSVSGLEAVRVSAMSWR